MAMELAKKMEVYHFFLASFVDSGISCCTCKKLPNVVQISNALHSHLKEAGVYLKSHLPQMLTFEAQCCCDIWTQIQQLYLPSLLSYRSFVSTSIVRGSNEWNSTCETANLISFVSAKQKKKASQENSRWLDPWLRFCKTRIFLRTIHQPCYYKIWTTFRLSAVLINLLTIFKALTLRTYLLNLSLRKVSNSFD